MKVLHLLKTSEGAAWALRQMRELKKLGVEVEVALPGYGPMVQRYRDLAIPLHFHDCNLGAIRSPAELMRMCRGFRELVVKCKPDIVHSHFVGTTMLARLALGRRSQPLRIFQVPGPLHLENVLTRRAEIVTAGRSDFWIASCAMTRNIYVKSGIDRARVGLSFYGTDIDQFNMGQKSKLRLELKLAPQTKIIGMVAYIYAPKRWLGQKRGLKGHEDLIDALAILRNQGHDVVGLFVGGAWGKAEAYESNVRQYGRDRLGDSAIFLGTRSEIQDIYADFDVAVHPSHTENLGGAVESLAAGIPTIATRVGGFPDIVIDGQTGWLAEPKAPASLAAAIAQVLDQPEEASRRALRGRKLIDEQLDVKVTALQVFKYYQEYLGEGL